MISPHVFRLRHAGSLARIRHFLDYLTFRGVKVYTQSHEHIPLRTNRPHLIAASQWTHYAC